VVFYVGVIELAAFGCTARWHVVVHKSTSCEAIIRVQAEAVFVPVAIDGVSKVVLLRRSLKHTGIGAQRSADVLMLLAPLPKASSL